MELVKNTNKKDWWAFRYYIFQNIKIRSIIRSIAISIVLLGTLLPFFELSLLGIQAQASLWEIVKTYPRFMVQEGYFTFYLFADLFLCFLLSPAFLSFVTLSKSYKQHLTEQQSKLVFSQWRFCLYDDTTTLCSAKPYSAIQNVIWLEDCIGLVLKNQEQLLFSIKHLPEAQQQNLYEYLVRIKEKILHIPEGSFATPQTNHVYWQKNVFLDEEQYLSMLQILFYLRKKQLNLFLFINSVALIAGYFVLGLNILLLIPFLLIIKCLSMQIPFLQKRYGKRCLKRQPFLLEWLSGDIAIDHTGISRYNKLYYKFTSWAQLTHTVVGKDGLLILQKNKIIAFLPSNLFSNPQEMLAFSHKINQWIKDSKHSVQEKPDQAE